MDRSRLTLNDLLITLVAVLVLGILIGGVYSVPAMYVTNSRNPTFTVLLAAGLSTTVFALGLAFGLPGVVLLAAWAIAMAALCARRWIGPLDHNLERFDMVHALAIVGMVWVVLIYRFIA